MSSPLTAFSRIVWTSGNLIVVAAFAAMGFIPPKLRLRDACSLSRSLNRSLCFGCRCGPPHQRFAKLMLSRSGELLQAVLVHGQHVSNQFVDGGEIVAHETRWQTDEKSKVLHRHQMPHLLAR